LAAAVLVAAFMENVLAPAAEFTTFLWVTFAMALARSNRAARPFIGSTNSC
jgi:hypothetical protein